MEPIIAPSKRGSGRSTKTRTSTPSAPEKPVAPKGQRVYFLDVPYEDRAIAQHFGARYFRGTGWAYIGTDVPADLLKYRPPRYSWGEWQERALRGEINALAPAPAPDPTTGTLTLRRDQLQDVKKILVARQAGAPEVLNASGLGAGKTAVTVAAIKRMAGIKNVLVICPLPVAAGWRMHLRDMGDGDMNWCIINYESTKKLLDAPPSALAAKKARTKNLQTVQKGTPKVQWDVVVIDESHYCFPQGTMIITEDGPREISDLVSDVRNDIPTPLVLSRASDGTLRYREIMGAFISPASPMVKVTHTLGDVVCTSDHPLYSTEHGYLSAHLLNPGDHLLATLLPDGSSGVTEVEVLAVEELPDTQEPTFNLSVDEDENYFASGVLAHNCSNPESQQTRAIDKIVNGPAHQPAFKINLSGTPGKDPSKMSYLHRGLYWADGQRPLPSITAERYIEWGQRHGLSIASGSYGNALSWVPESPTTGQRELTRMNQIIFSGEAPWGFRRVPDWPDQQRIVAPIELSPEETQAYNLDWREFQRVDKEIFRRLRSPQVSGKEIAALKAKGLAQQTRFRQKAGVIRAPGTAAFASEFVNKGYQVAISAEHLDVVDALREELERKNVPVAVFTGQNREVREAERVAYQRGEKKVIIFTPAEGFNLHAGEEAVGGNTAPRVTMVAQPRWSPGKALQIEGRGQRNGTTAPVYYLYAEGTVEEDVIKRCVDGMQSIGTINGDDTQPFEGIKEALGVHTVYA